MRLGIQTYEIEVITYRLITPERPEQVSTIKYYLCIFVRIMVNIKLSKLRSVIIAF